MVLSCLEESNNYVVEKELTTSGDELTSPFLEKDELEKAKQIASVENAVALGSMSLKDFVLIVISLAPLRLLLLKEIMRSFMLEA